MLQIPSPTNPVNEWSCALACVEWQLINLLKIPNAPTQNEMLGKFANHFPSWQKQPNPQLGVCSRADLIRILELVGFPFRDFLHISDKAEIEVKIGKNDRKIIFVLTRKPTNHCMALLGKDTQNKLVLMSPSQPTGEYISKPLDQLVGEHDPDFLFVYF